MRAKPIWVALLLSLVAIGGLGTSVFAPAMTPAALGDLELVGPLPQYRLSLRVEFTADGPLIDGSERLEYVNNEGRALEELYLRLYPNGDQIYGAGGLTISDMEVDGELLAPQLEDERMAVRIPLGEPLLPGEELVVELDFSGAVPQNFASRSGSSYGIYDYTRGVLKLANWFPLLAAYDEEGWHLDPIYPWGDAVYSETALFEVWITAPEDQVVVASGTELDRVSNPDGTVTHHYVSGPMRDFFVGMSPDFRRFSTQIGETQVNSYYLEGDEPGGQAALAVAANAVELFNQVYGLYPFAELDVLETPLPWIGGVEYPGLILISDKLYGSAEYLSREELQFTMIVAHEAAHQWWYNLVGNDVIGEPWLDEALATYSSGIYIEEFLGEAAFEELLRDWQRSYERARGWTDVPVTAPLDQFTHGTYYGIVYCGGALFYHELRAEIGDGPFFAGLQEYLRRFKYRVASTEDLLGIFTEVSGQDLEGLYNEWLFAPQESLVLELH